jgi:RNA polymerase sigma-70 factor (ECF subfamily)
MDARAIPVRSASDATTISESERRPERFAEVFDRHFLAIHRYLARRAGRDVADDLAAQCFTIAFERRSSFGNALSTGADLDRTGIDRIDGDLARALASLHRTQRDVLLLFAWAELSYEQISAALDIPVGTVRSRISRARARVRATLDATGHDVMRTGRSADERRA